ncbi:T9SS type A sorting domain-containing protein [Dyadobacter sandarakinus]|uniref:T9SS type A sorting domain-containing protein n=1 Tax=Dyadobacter sandarakinus TaxID=2747268 RepID=A0ABX7I421_9BACT|nr:T9SS type A sorting domain-containing protein [Dyadobacter sandarakinus]QRR00819.1 T9SS type A sorting domain-containing protein [Dyadobacter sandarakinus]
MNYVFLNVAIFFLAITSLLAQPAIQWEKTIGGPNGAFLSYSQQTADGGYILGGSASNGTGYDKSDPGSGASDYWIAKLDADGRKEWDYAFGGPGQDQLITMQQTSDGGYILGGHSNSDAGGDKSEDCRGGSNEGYVYPDYWIIKISANGVKEWDKTLGSNGEDLLRSLQQTSDGGYIVSGSSSSSAGFDKTTAKLGLYDLWVVKLNADGSKLWDKSYGRPGTLHSGGYIRQIGNGGYILAGTINYFQSDDMPDYKVFSLSSDGSIQWEKSYGGSGSDNATSIIETKDSGYLVGGTSNTNADGDKSGESLPIDGSTSRLSDYWILKLNVSGKIQWEKTIGGASYDAGGYIDGSSSLSSLSLTSDGGYLVGGSSSAQAGRSKTENNKGTASYGTTDYWIVKISELGNKEWDKTIGGNRSDQLTYIHQTTDGGFFLTGRSGSNASGDKTEDNRTGNEFSSDGWVIKLASENPLPVNLTSFVVEKEFTSTMLSWTTTSETNNDHFEVQYSTDAKAWNLLAMINAAEESTKSKTYQFTHVNPANGDNFYRLKMVDTDGTFTYSKKEHLKFNQGISVSVYPNPVTETIHLQAADWSKVKGLQILNNQGKALYSSGNKPSQDINARSLEPGLYFIKVTLSDGTETTRKIVLGQ